ncbi:hypothetical protein [Halalkaliarchaeum sp. AArc-CO]|nr:hypothetical protein [Halalkaliarchaeum sp. AArc-CO]
MVTRLTRVCEEFYDTLLNKLFERRLLAIYAGTVVGIGITVGLLFNILFI